MVSGFFTSPCDHSRIFSGDASEMRIAENDSGSLGFSKKLKMSFILPLLFAEPFVEEPFEAFESYSPPSSLADADAGCPPAPPPEAVALALTLAATSRA